MAHLGRTLALFWLLYSVFHTSFDVAVLRSAAAPVPYPRLTLTTLLHSAVWAAFSWLLFRACDFALSRRRPFARRAAFLGAVVATWALRLVCYALTLALLRTPPRIDRASFVRALQSGASGVAVFTIVLAATAVGMRWWQRQLQAARHRAESEETLVRAELRVVAEQLEPHFLLNTLTSIQALATNDASAARDMLTGLRELLSYSIRHGAAATVSLEDEVHFVRQYLRLQSLRFGTRLRTRIAIPAELLDCRIPRLILQPLVENAIKYGVARREDGGEIALDAERGVGMLTIHIRNSSAGTPDSPGFGIGMAAVRARLSLLFGAAQRVTLTDDGAGMTVVTVTMPLVEKKRIAA
ncbi:MAG: two-component system, LytTR family, sensor kinase [Acidobacteriota bacterium]|nr:two-component system, LytTR family, sensor kinase [Acidobacteriota bacterium]